MHLKRKSWSVDDIIRQIHAIARESSSPYNEGYTSFGCKQDLYVIKEVVETALSKCPNFGQTEEEWLDQREKERIINILKE